MSTTLTIIMAIVAILAFGAIMLLANLQNYHLGDDEDDEYEQWPHQ